MHAALQRKAIAFARQMLDNEGLTKWRFRFNNNKRRLGVCHYRHQRIEISIHMGNLGEEKVKQVIAHEVAHAAVGLGHHHDNVWRQKAISLGDTGERCSPVDMGVPEQYIGTCPNGHTFGRHRATHKRTSCPKCSPRFDERFLLKWAINHANVEMA